MLVVKLNKTMEREKRNRKMKHKVKLQEKNLKYFTIINGANIVVKIELI